MDIDPVHDSVMFFQLRSPELKDRSSRLFPKDTDLKDFENSWRETNEEYVEIS